MAAAAARQRADDSALARRTRERYEQVQALRAQGLGIKPIMRQTGLAKETVRRFYRAATADELLPGIRTIERGIMSALSPDERTRLLDMLAKILARSAQVAGERPEPLSGRRNRPARVGS